MTSCVWVKRLWLFDSFLLMRVICFIYVSFIFWFVSISWFTLFSTDFYSLLWCCAFTPLFQVGGYLSVHKFATIQHLSFFFILWSLNSSLTWDSGVSAKHKNKYKKQLFSSDWYQAYKKPSQKMTTNRAPIWKFFFIIMFVGIVECLVLLGLMDFHSFEAP